VLSLVSELNESWRRRGFKPLKLIGAEQLHPQFLELAADFWPVEPPEVRGFLTLYLAEGKGDLDQAAFCAFLHKLLSEKEWSKKEALRRIAAANLFASYLLETFHRSEDYWSAFQGWTIAAAHQLWMAEIHQLATKDIRASFDLVRSAALNALSRLNKEALKERALSPQGTELDDYTRLRNTVSVAAVAAERTGKFHDAEHLLIHLLSAVSNRNAQHAEAPFASPDVGPDDVLADVFAKAKEQKPKRGRRGVYSWSLESLVHLTTRRLRRQTLAALWSQITKVDMAAFKPVRPADVFLWRCDNGEELTRKAGKPQSWKELLAAARADEHDALSRGVVADPDFALMFALAYPHRADRALVKALDTWFA
jgi:hypothetical protein